jgi:hypothetical protein
MCVCVCVYKYTERYCIILRFTHIIKFIHSSYQEYTKFIVRIEHSFYSWPWHEVLILTPYPWYKMNSEEQCFIYANRQQATYFSGCFNFSYCHNKSFCATVTHFSLALPHLCQYAFILMLTCLETCFEDDTYLIFVEKRARRINILLHSRLM